MREAKEAKMTRLGRRRRRGGRRRRREEGEELEIQIPVQKERQKDRKKACR